MVLLKFKFCRLVKVGDCRFLIRSALILSCTVLLRLLLYQVDPGHSISDEKQNFTVNLRHFRDFQSDSSHIFFIESSGKTFFRGRECCALESAALNSKLSLIAVLMTSKIVHLHASTCTRNLFKTYKNIQFFTIELADLFKSLPLEGVERKHDFSEPFAATKLSDLMRASVVYKYGGFYSDLDIVVLKDLTDLKNFYPMQSNNFIQYVFELIVG